jgi:hypothetical protein
VIGQSSKCSLEKIKRMLDSEMSVDEIKQVCKKSTKPKKKSTSKKLSKPEKVTTVKESSIPKIDIPKKPLNYSNKFDGGVFISLWGIGLQGNYFYTNEILFGGDIISITNSVKSSGTYASADGEITLNTYEGYARYYFRGIELTDGFFGQGGFAIRSWIAKADFVENSTGSKIGSVKMEWSPYVLVTGLGWHKIWENGVSFSSSMNGVWGGKTKIDYEENLYRFDSNTKTELEKLDAPLNLVIYVGYSF